HPFAALRRGYAARPSSLDGDAVQLILGREAGTARRGEQDVFAIGRPAGGIVVGGVGGQPARPAAADGNDKNVVTAMSVGGEGERAPIGAENGIDVMSDVLRDGPGDAANGLDRPDVA